MSLPDCKFRTSMGPDNRALCLSPIVSAPGQLVSLSQCERCRVYDRDVEPRDPATIEPAPEEYAEAGPCPFRGPVVRRETCKACGQRGQVAEVYSCEKFGACTLRARGLKGVKSCLGCEELPRGN